jgi:hypothetical protein
VESLTSFIALRISGAESGFEVFLAAAQEQVSTPEFIERLAIAAGTTSRLFSMPTSVLRVLLGVSGRQEVRDSLMVRWCPMCPRLLHSAGGRRSALTRVCAWRSPRDA